VKDLDSGLLEREPSIPWREIIKMRDRLAHRYFDTQHEIVGDVVNNELPQLGMAVKQLRRYVADIAKGQTSREDGS
jgi:uncharacterized protein with HEPN domain